MADIKYDGTAEDREAYITGDPAYQRPSSQRLRAIMYDGIMRGSGPIIYAAPGYELPEPAPSCPPQDGSRYAELRTARAQGARICDVCGMPLTWHAAQGGSDNG